MGEHDGEHKESSGIKIVDKRRFTATGDARHDGPTEDPKKPIAVVDPRAAAPGAQPRQAGPTPFMSFVTQFAAQAMAAMGLLPEAQSRGIPVDPAMAREYIEIIAMLQEKTRGNLAPEEDNALVRLVNELRMQFVEVTQGPAAAGPGQAPGLPRGGRMPQRPGSR